MNVIECTNLSKTFKKDYALHNLSFTIGENKIVGLIGRNGAGKTTLMKLMSGFLHESSGSISVFSRRPFNSLTVSANSIFIDDKMNFPSALTLSDILKEGKRFYENWDKTLSERLFKYFSLNPNQIHKNLSKGKKSTFNLIVGLAARCPLTILDEPMTGMDASVRKDMYRAVLKEYLAYPRTIILSSHHLEEIEDLLEEVLLIDEGRKQLHLSIDELKELAIGLTGKPDLLHLWVQNKEILHTAEVGTENEYVVIKNEFSKEELQQMKYAGITISSVSASDVCVYLTAKMEGSIDDVFHRD